LKRVVDVAGSLLALVLLAPAMLLVAAFILADSGGPVIFRQLRVGRGGKTFLIHKFRTMNDGQSDFAPALTGSTDPRITRVGRFLRRHKLDELPQLFDVIAGNMSLVGPRPELPQFVAICPDDVRSKVLSVRPGMTDLASIEFFDEGDMFAGALHPERIYVESILPRKLALATEYVDRQSLRLDFMIMAKTILHLLRPGRTA